MGAGTGREVSWVGLGTALMAEAKGRWASDIVARAKGPRTRIRNDTGPRNNGCGSLWRNNAGVRRPDRPINGAIGAEMGSKRASFASWCDMGEPKGDSLDLLLGWGQGLEEGGKEGEGG